MTTDSIRLNRNLEQRVMRRALNRLKTMFPENYQFLLESELAKEEEKRRYEDIYDYVTKKQAIKDCRKFWVHIAEGRALDKREALKLEPELRDKYIEIGISLCPLCTYVELKSSSPQSCKRHCPYFLQFKQHCYDSPTSFYSNPLQFAERIMELKEE